MSLQRQRVLARLYDPFAAAGLHEVEIFGANDRQARSGPRVPGESSTSRVRPRLADARKFSDSFPSCEVIGIDVDPEIVAGAEDQHQVEKSKLRFVVGRAEAPPVDGQFDAIVSSLLFHHLPRASKRSSLARVADLLEPGGLLAYGRLRPPTRRDVDARRVLRAVQIADGFEDTQDNLDGSYVRLMTEAGLRDGQELGRWRSPLGTVVLYKAHRVAA